MKKFVLTLGIAFLCSTSFSQAITDTAAFIKASGDKDYLMLDGKLISDNFGANFSSSMVNQKIILNNPQGQPIMLLSLPYNGGHSPVFGNLTVMSGKKLAVKKGTLIAKIDMKPNLISVDDGGTVAVFEFNELHWFFGKDITIVDTDTQQTHKLSFKIGMFIEKK